MTNAQREQLKRLAQCELARRDFWEFCKVLAPDFYVEGREYLKRLCHELQEFYESDEAVMIINAPPRHGKSRTVQLFTPWVLGKDTNEKIMTGSYNETLATTFSRGVRNLIMERKLKGGKIVYSEIFPKTTIKRGDAAANLWSLEGGHANYLATSPTGTATGFGASILIVDDLIKNAEEAFNESILEKHWNWFTQTMLSRLEKGGKIIIIMTRWSTKDLAGRAVDFYKRVGKPIRHINLKALQEDGTMLCDDVLDKESFESKKEAIGADIVSANYQQEPLDSQGRLYKGFKTYTDIPRDKLGNVAFEQIRCYCDTADKGNDYLSLIIYGVYERKAYVLDVYFTKDGMEVTEPETARRLYEYKVQLADIESNNGGRGFGRSVERILREKHHHYKTSINLFFQSRNKKARILGASTWVQDNVLFPEGWDFKYSEFYKDLMQYTKEGKAKHDDAEDSLSGIYDMIGRGAVYSWD